MIVAELERALLARYPKMDAEGWDHVGLSVEIPLLRSPVLPARSMRPKLMFSAPKKPVQTCC